MSVRINQMYVLATIGVMLWVAFIAQSADMVEITGWIVIGLLFRYGWMPMLLNWYQARPGKMRKALRNVNNLEDMFGDIK